STSRPRASVPSTYTRPEDSPTEPGPSSRSPRSCEMGSYGATIGAAAATTISKSKTTNPVTAIRFRSSVRHTRCQPVTRPRSAASGLTGAESTVFTLISPLPPQPRVNDRVQDVNEEIYQHEDA